MAMPLNEMLFVVGLGIGTVFVGLIAIIILCKIISAFCKGAQNKETVSKQVPTQSAVSQQIENRQEIIAAVSACLAEELGTEISALRILSFKKI